MDDIFIAYLRIRNFLLVSRAISLASNSKLLIGHVRYEAVASLKTKWEISSIMFLV